MDWYTHWKNVKFVALRCESELACWFNCGQTQEQRRLKRPPQTAWINLETERPPWAHHSLPGLPESRPSDVIHKGQELEVRKTQQHSLVAATGTASSWTAVGAAWPAMIHLDSDCFILSVQIFHTSFNACWGSAVTGAPGCLSYDQSKLSELRI